MHKGHYFGTEVAIKTVFTENDEVNMMYLQREINVLKYVHISHSLQYSLPLSLFYLVSSSFACKSI